MNSNFIINILMFFFIFILLVIKFQFFTLTNRLLLKKFINPKIVPYNI